MAETDESRGRREPPRREPDTRSECPIVQEFRAAAKAVTSRDQVAAQRSRSDKIRGSFKRAVKKIVRQIDEHLPHTTGEDSVSVAMQWLSQTLDWIQLWADADQAQYETPDNFDMPIRPTDDSPNSFSMHLHL